MKKTFIAALLVVTSFSVFAANDYKVEKISVPSMALNVFSNLDLDAGATVGNCQILRKEYEGDIVKSKNEKFILEIEGQGKTVNIVVKKDGTMSTSTKGTHVILNASSQTSKAGVKTTKDLKLVIKTANYTVQATELSIVTKKSDSTGAMRVVRDQSLLCRN